MKVASCRIERIEIIAFGKLHNFSLELEDGINLFTAPNESGKSTLANFLRFVFYGFSDARKKELAENDKKLYTPWGSSRADGSVVVKKGDVSYRVSRTSVGAKETPEVISVATGRPAFEGEVPGEALFGVSEEVFSRTLFFRQMTLPQGKEKDGVLAEQLQNLAVSEEEQVCSRDALKKLTEAKNELKGRTAGSGWIPRLEQECARLERELAEAKREREEWEALSSERQTLRERLEQSSAACTRVEEEQKNLERWDAKQKCEQIKRIRMEAERAREAFETASAQARGDRTSLTGLLTKAMSLDTARSRVNSAEEELRRAEQEASSKDLRQDGGKRNGSAVFPILLIIGLLLGVAGVLIALHTSYAGILVSAAGVAAVVAGFLLRQRQVRFAAEERAKAEEAKRQAEALRIRVDDLRLTAERERESLRALEQTLMTGYEEIGLPTPKTFDGQLLTAQLQEALSLCEERDRRRAACESAETAARIASDGVDLAALEELASGASEPLRSRVDVERDLAFLRQQQKLLTEKEGLLRDKIAALEGRSADPALLAGKLEATARKLAECRRRYEVYEAARSGIEEASERLKSMTAPRLGKIAGQYFSAATGGKYEGIETDTRLAMRVRENGIGRESEFLSAGTRDCAALSLRLAMIGLLFGGAGMPIVLDDAFGRLDDTRLEDTMRVLGEAAKQHQILLLCCTNREENALRNAGVAFGKIQIDGR